MFGFLGRWLKKSVTQFNLPQNFLTGVGSASWTNHNYRNFVLEGYVKNVIVYHCVANISQAAASIPFILEIDGKEVDQDEDKKNPILKLLHRPNKKQSYQKWLREFLIYRLIDGNAYAFANFASAGRKRFLMELQNLRPDRVRVLDTNCIPYAYEYTINASAYQYPIDESTGKCDVLHDKELHPLSDIYGLSPMTAAAMSIDQHNDTSAWNKRLIENAGKPAGIVSIKNRGDAISTSSIDADEIKRIQDRINNRGSAYKDKGAIIFSDSELDYKQLGLSPNEMDWLSGKNSLAREICLAYKYPPILLGIPDSATFNNMQEAKLSLYEECVIPLIEDVFASISHYLTLNLEKDITLYPDLDQVTAMIPRREDARRSAREDVTAGIINVNEAREESRREPIVGAGELFVPAGKLPLSFDQTATATPQKMDKVTLKKLLASEGFSKDNISRMVKVAYASAKRKDG